MAPYSFTIFTKKNMIKNVLPFFLNGGVQDVVSDSSDVEWNGSSSFVNISASGARTLSFGVADPSGRPVKPGTMVVIMKTDNNANAITVDPSPDMEVAADTFVLDIQNQTCLLMFKAPYGSNTKGEWVLLAKDAGTTFSGGTVSANTVFSRDVEIEGNVGFYNTTPIAKQSLAADGSDLPTTQALANDIKAKLIALGLCS